METAMRYLVIVVFLLFVAACFHGCYQGKMSSDACEARGGVYVKAEYGPSPRCVAVQK